MYWLIETKDQLDKFSSLYHNETFIEIIPINDKAHPVTNNVCAIYMHPLDSDKGYIINISHSESLELPLKDIEDLINKFKIIYSRDKKELLHYIFHKNIIDLTLKKEYKIEHTLTHNIFYNRYPDKLDINKIIPITKHYQYCDKIFKDLKKHIVSPVNDFHNNKTTLVFNYIERNGIKINKEEFEKRFHKINEDTCYTQYNFKTTTTRPSNKFKSVNYAALNKNNGDRICFIPQNDIFLEIDINAYHPTLLAKLIDYNFGDKDIHEVFAEMYGVVYDESKNITFKQLYGGIFPQYKELEFFKKADEYTYNLWGKFINDGFIECPISRNRLYNSELEDMNPPKLLNYLLQSLETSNNVIILWDIIKILRGKKTKLVLYTFDSILLDVEKSEKEIIKNILEVFKKYDLKTKMKYGMDYHNMEIIKI
jgi:hypothetical protein